MSDLERSTLYVARVALWENITRQKVLIGQRLHNSKNYPNSWEFPGGKYTPPADASLEGMRELWEEANIRGIRLFPGEKVEHEYVMDVESSPYFDWLIFTHLTEAIAFHPETLTEEPKEHQSLRWAELEELDELELNPQAKFAVPYLKRQRAYINRAAHYHMPWMNDGARKHR